MLRIRRYRVFLVFAAIVVFTFYNFWQTGPEGQSARGKSFGTAPYGDAGKSSAQNGDRNGQDGRDPVRPVVDIQGIAHSADALPVTADKATSAKPLLADHTQVVANGVPIVDLLEPTSTKLPVTVNTPVVANGDPVIEPEPSTSEALAAIQTAPPTPITPPTPAAIAYDDTVDEDGQKKTIHWEKPTEHYPIAPGDLIHLPTGTPKKMPRIQFEFPEESVEARSLREERRDLVRDEFLHAWQGYKKYAWGHDEVGPVKGGFRDPFCGWAATIVDSLDTLWIMGLKDEFEEALETVEKIDFTTSPKTSIPVFETTIRYLGGMLAAYDISDAKYPVLLMKATELGEILMSIFDTPNRMPVLHYQWQPHSASERHRAAGNSNFAELGSLTLEFTRLAQLTGEHKYYDAVARITNALVEWQERGTEIKGIFPDSVDASGCNATFVPPEKTPAAVPSQNATAKVFPRRTFTEEEICRPQGLTPGPQRQSFSMGGGQDSTYEYFSKMHLLLGGLDSTYRTLYNNTMDAIRTHLLYRPLIPGDRNVLFSGKVQLNPYLPDDRNHEMIYEVTHLTCFIGGMVGMGAKLFGLDADLAIAEKLADGCVWAYEATKSGVMPEDARAVPCENPLDCDWDEEKYYKYLDSRWSLREGEIADYDKEKARKDKVRLEMAEKKAKEEAEEKVRLETEAKEKPLMAETDVDAVVPRANGTTVYSLGGSAPPVANINRKRAISTNATVAHTDDEEKEALPEIPYVAPSKTSTEGVPVNPHERSLPKGREDPYRPLSHEEFISDFLERSNLPIGFAKVESDKYILRYVSPLLSSSPSPSPFRFHFR
jgi:mannosyl-oligosaccharide alpha-1,2-mannosidase